MNRDSVGMMIDQHIQDRSAVLVDFFNRPASTTSAIAALALRTGAPIVPVFALPMSDGRYRMIYEAPVAPPDADDPDAVRTYTQRCTDVLEMYVRRYPELWLWMHRRWRMPPIAHESGDRRVRPGGRAGARGPGEGCRSMMTRLHTLIDRFGGREIAVVGDLVADEFIYGEPSRVSREAPVLILKYDRTTIVPGGAGNAASNVAALGGRVRLVARVGGEDLDRRVVRALPRRVERAGLVRPPGYHVPVQERASWPGGFTPPGSRSCVSIARLPGRPTRRAVASSSGRRGVPSRGATGCSSPTTGAVWSRRPL